MKTYKEYILEKLIEPSNEKNTMTFWHGGNLDVINDDMVFKSGRYEFGTGLYLTTHYNTAKKYAKGSRKFYQVVVEKGNDANDIKLSLDIVYEFLAKYAIKSKISELKSAMNKWELKGDIPAFIFINLMLNYDAVRSSNRDEIRKFLVANNVDYLLVSNAFGYGETMMVLFNNKKIISKTQVKPKDEIKEFDLPTKFV